MDVNESWDGGKARVEPLPEFVELVDHPRHYNEHPSGIECIDVIEHMTFNIGTAIKHLWRAGLKPGNPSAQDLRKAVWYIEREIQRLTPPPPEQEKRWGE